MYGGSQLGFGAGGTVARVDAAGGAFGCRDDDARGAAPGPCAEAASVVAATAVLGGRGAGSLPAVPGGTAAGAVDEGIDGVSVTFTRMVAVFAERNSPIASAISPSANTPPMTANRVPLDRRTGPAPDHDASVRATAIDEA